ncbi:hypothetical protein ACFL6X_08285 [Candidatus Latescibacterota bacterium]
MSEDQLPQLIERHTAWWDRSTCTLLEQVSEYTPPATSESKPPGLPLADGTRSVEGQVIPPELIDPTQFYNGLPADVTPVHGDFIGGMSPPHLCWTEATVGCPVRVAAGGPWAEPIAADWRNPSRIEADPRWLEKLEEFVRLLVERAQGRCPVTQPLMRGPTDMMASAVGHEEACMALIDEPGRAADFLARCSSIFVDIAERRLRHTPPFHGGYLSSYGIWAPGTVVRTQIDNATLVSPAMYRDQLLEHDRVIMDAFDFSLIHVHSGCLHVVDALLDVDELQAIQVSIDHPGGPLAHEVVPILERVVRHKPLIVTGPVTPPELESLRQLGQHGSLCLNVRLELDRA